MHWTMKRCSFSDSLYSCCGKGTCSAYGDVVESKAGQGVKLLNILKKYCEDLTSMTEGKNEELLTAELSGRAKIHYIFQSIFIKRLEVMDDAKQPIPEAEKEASDEPSLICPVCLSALNEPSSTTCGHVFCSSCIEKAIEKHKKCPTCRKKLTKKNFHRIYLPSD